MSYMSNLEIPPSFPTYICSYYTRFGVVLCGCSDANTAIEVTELAIVIFIPRGYPNALNCRSLEEKLN